MTLSAALLSEPLESTTLDKRLEPGIGPVGIPLGVNSQKHEMDVARFIRAVLGDSTRLHQRRSVNCVPHTRGSPGRAVKAGNPTFPVPTM